jgi:putative salt-induced outer membrane protein YdiY
MKYAAAALLAGLPCLAYADLGPSRTNTGKIEVKDNKPYRLDADAGYLLNSSKSGGKSSSKENLAAHLLFQRQAGIWGQELRAEAVSTNDDGDSSNNVERYMLAGKLLYRSTDTAYQYLKLQGDKDLSSSLDYQIALTGGIGLDVIKTQKQSLTTELGAGYRHSKARDFPYGDAHELIGTLGLYYQYQFNDTVRFNQDLGYEFGDESQVLRSRSSISANLTETISAVMSYQLKDTLADSGNSRDSLLSVGMKYSY